MQDGKLGNIAHFSAFLRCSFLILSLSCRCQFLASILSETIKGHPVWLPVSLSPPLPQSKSKLPRRDIYIVSHKCLA